MHRLSLFICAAGIAAASALSASAENIIYKQAPYFSDNIIGYYSENSSLYPHDDTAVYDNFSLSSAATVGKVEWEGTEIHGAYPSQIPTGFTVLFFDTENGGPGRELYSQHVSGDANSSTQNLMYGYDYNLYSANTSFHGDANTEYWLSIIADVGSSQSWSWVISSAGDSQSYDFFQGKTVNHAVDQTFTLYDDAVTPTGPTNVTPEPASLMLTGTGLLAFAGAARRKIFGR